MKKASILKIIKNNKPESAAEIILLKMEKENKKSNKDSEYISPYITPYKEGINGYGSPGDFE